MSLSDYLKNGTGREEGMSETDANNDRIPFTESSPIRRIYLTASQCFTASYKQIVMHQLLQADPPVFLITDSFGKDVLNLSVSSIQKKIESAEAMIAIVSPYYGNEFEQECSACPINSICKSKATICFLSYLHYQILLAQMYDLQVYILAPDAFNDIDKALTGFQYDKEKCKAECSKLYSLQIVNQDCAGGCSVTTKQLYEDAKRTNALLDLIRERHYPIINFSDTSSLKIAISSVLGMIEKDFKDSTVGVVSYESIVGYIEKAKLYDDVSLKGISNIFINQDEALNRIDSLYKENQLYGKNSQVKVLCFRGNSFITDHEWGKFVFSKYTKKSSQIEIEFMLANLDNKDVILRRWEAFSKDEEDFESFKKKYTNAMKRVKEILLNDEDEYECKLYIHNVAELPFRMVFLGEYLYLSFFLNAVKATDSTVYEVRQGSALYSACLEYYDRIKINSKLATK